MPSHPVEHAVVGLLRQCYTASKCQAGTPLSKSSRAICRHPTSTPQYGRAFLAQNGNFQSSKASQKSIRRRNIHSTPIRATQNEGQQDNKPERIAVLGGGIAGLASAHYLAREKPSAIITLYEGSDRLGGWLRSTPVDVGDGIVVFESGPRTLRVNTPASLATLEMMTQLGLRDEVLPTFKNSPAAQNRFVYYPDHLVRMPGPGQDLYNMLWTVFTEPVFKGTGYALLEFLQEKRPDNLEDESVASFLKRRLNNSDTGDNLVSAVLHGIYGGDIYQLSARSLLPRQWWAEGTYGSISASGVATMRERTQWSPAKDLTLAQDLSTKIDIALFEILRPASVFTFKEGMETLVKALEKDLRSRPNVQIRLNENINKIEYDSQNDNVKVLDAKNQPTQSFSTVISTLSARNLATLSAAPLPSLASQRSVTVMTVNLFYRDPHLLDEPGFGYLIPRSIPFEQNPECALGVVFDSCSCIGQDTVEGTKLTVMLGGHWWDHFPSDALPSEEEGLEMAKAILKRHLKIEDEPEAWKVGVHKDCIPQYTVGHEKRMRQAGMELIEGFKGRLRVAGSSYGGVGVHDCVRGARDVVMGVVEWSGPGAKTGLEDFGLEKRWVGSDITKQLEELKS